MAGESFNYDDADAPDEVIRSVAASMSDSALKPLTDLEIAERDEWRRDYLARQQQENIAADEYRLEKEREREAVAQREAAIAAQQAREKASVKRQREIDREVNRRALLNLGAAASRADTFQRDVRTSHAQNVKQQYYQTLMGELDAMINAPKPEVSDSFAARYRNNQRSGLYYVPEDSDE
jgi:hypothetical protein